MLNWWVQFIYYRATPNHGQAHLTCILVQNTSEKSPTLMLSTMWSRWVSYPLCIYLKKKLNKMKAKKKKRKRNKKKKEIMERKIQKK